MDSKVDRKEAYQRPQVVRVRLDSFGTVLGCNKTVAFVCGVGRTQNT